MKYKKYSAEQLVEKGYITRAVLNAEKDNYYKYVASPDFISAYDYFENKGCINLSVPVDIQEIFAKFVDENSKEIMGKMMKISGGRLQPTEILKHLEKLKEIE
jgi:hypothetical protein